MDSDLAEALNHLRTILDKRRITYAFGTNSKAAIESVKQQLKLPLRYCFWLLEADPVDLQVVTPIENVQFIALNNLLQEQVGFSLNESFAPLELSKQGSWRRSWVIIAYGVLGDPYFLDTSQTDAEGDCPVFTAMTGTDRWQPRLAASSFVQFLQIITSALELAAGFGEAEFGIDDEDVFREALGPKVRAIDLAAFRAGHWT